MRCPLEDDNQVLLVDYCARRLAPERARWLEQHIAECPGCRRFVASQKTVWDALDAWEPEPVSPAFRRTLYQRIEREAARPWWRRVLEPAAGSPYRWLRPAIPLALACSATLGVFLMRAPRTQDWEAAGTAQVRAERVDIEQVERALEDMDLLLQLPQAAAVAGADSAADSLTM